MSTSNFRAGYAEVDYTPEPGLGLFGQMDPRIAQYARDPLVACAAAYQNSAATVVIVAVDICMLSTEFVQAVQQRFAGESGLDANALVIHSTHTHVAPVPVELLLGKPDPAFMEILENSIVGAALTAIANLEAVEVFAGTGHMEQMGWNRRAMFDDGTTRMYGHSEMPGFVGMEGPRDPALPVLWTRNAEGEITGVLVSFATHPNALESEHFYSADIPGAVRKYLRRLVGEKAQIVYLTAAAGDTAPSILDPHDASQPWRGEAGVERSGLYLAGEAARVIAAGLVPMEAPELSLQKTVLQVGVRAWPQQGEPTYPLFENAYYQQSEADWPRRVVENNPVAANLNVIRIGDAVICTNPAELFVEFGLQIRAASPAKVTFISELTDGTVGYVPTAVAFSRGGYETWCCPSSGLEEEAGDKIVAATKEMLRVAF